MIPRELVTIGSDLKPVRRLRRLRRDEQVLGSLAEKHYDRLFCNCVDVIADLLRESGDIAPDSRLRLLSQPGKQIAHIDVLLAEVGPRDEFRRLVLVEDKLSTNRECRRDVLAQILEYAHTLERLALEEIGDEANQEWVDLYGDEIGRSMRSGDCLLIVCGDAIDPGLVTLVTSYVSRLDPAKRSRLVLVGLGIYTDGDTHFFVPTVVSGTDRVTRDLTIRVTVQTPAGTPLEVGQVRVEPTPPDPESPEEGAVDPTEYMQKWTAQHGLEAARAWEGLRNALSQASIPSLAVGNYTGGAPFIYLRNSQIGRVDLLRLSDSAPEMRDLLHKNTALFANPNLAEARRTFRAALRDAIPAARIGGTVERVYLPITEAARRSDAVVEAITAFAASVGAL